MHTYFKNSKGDLEDWETRHWAFPGGGESSDDLMKRAGKFIEKIIG